MNNYRNNIQIMADMLQAVADSGQGGIRITPLIQKSNLAHKRISKFIDKLTGTALINKIEYDGNHAFVITEKGRSYLESYAKFHDMAESFGLEL